MNQLKLTPTNPLEPLHRLIEEEASHIPLGGVSDAPLERMAFRDMPAVYVVVDVTPDAPPRVLDVGESGEVQTRLRSHDRKHEWLREARGVLHVCVYYSLRTMLCADTRRDLERRLRDATNPPCGER
jgi:hypothetical protein